MHTNLLARQLALTADTACITALLLCCASMLCITALLRIRIFPLHVHSLADLPAPLVGPGHDAIAEALQVVLADGVAAAAGTRWHNKHNDSARVTSLR
jgi:hypothetical protein